MEVLFRNPPPSPQRQSPPRGRKPGKPLTARELAARRANLEKARAAWSQGCRRTEKRLRASRANLEKAIAARRSPQGNASARLNALKHGLFAKRTLAESVDRLGEDKEEFDRHLRLFERVFAPADEEEKPIVKGLAETVWRRLRFFRAQACWEKEKLQKIFAEAPPDPSDLDDTVARANGLNPGPHGIPSLLPRAEQARVTGGVLAAQADPKTLSRQVPLERLQPAPRPVDGEI